MQLGRLNVRISRQSVINDKRLLADTNKVKGSPAIIYSRSINVTPTRTNRWWAARYNVNNAWIFNGNNGNLNNNNVNNANRCQAVAILPIFKVYAFIFMTEVIFFAMLLGVMFETRQNKRYGRDSMAFEMNWAPLLVRLMRELTARTYRILHNYTFLTSIPKWREIFATEFSGRIVDHILCDTLRPWIEKELHPRTFNNRKGMGSQAAINQVIEDICEASNDYTEAAWVIKWDLAGFFPNANCDYMESCFVRVIDKYQEEIVDKYGTWVPAFLKWIAMIAIHCCPARHYERRTPKYLWEIHIKPEKSILNKPDGVGVPIGRMSSQTGMGLYINDEVRWLNDECGIHTTVFMDDGVMVVPDRLKEYALSLIPELRKRLIAKGVCVNDKKFYCQQYWKGLEFLGSHIHPWSIILNDAAWARCLARIAEYNQLSIADKYRELDHFIATVNSYSGLLKNCTSYKRILRLKNVISDDWWTWIEWDARRQCVISKPKYSFRARLNKKYKLKLKRI